MAPKPQKNISRLMPAPGPVPTSQLNVSERTLLVARICGSRTKSARVPAMIGEMGLVNQAMSRRAENTRPCTSGATLACQMAWFEELTNGDTSAAITMPTIQIGNPPLRPTSTRPMPEIAHPPRTPCTRRLKPPHALMITPPITPPIAPAVCTEPSMRVSLPVRERIIGASNVKAMPKKRLPTKKIICKPSKLGRAKIYLKP